MNRFRSVQCAFTENSSSCAPWKQLYYNWKDASHCNQTSLITILWFTFIMNITVDKVSPFVLAAWVRPLSLHNYRVSF